MSVIVLLAGCADGYPTDDDGLMLHHGMSESEAVQAMNQVGDADHLDRRWRYALEPGCLLEVETRRLFLIRASMSVILLGTEAVATRDATTGEYSVAVRPRAGASSRKTTVLEGADWTDAGEMRWLLNHVASRCDGSRGVGL